mgnify:CR=1 FL=1
MVEPIIDCSHVYSILHELDLPCYMDENNDVHRVDECEICLNLVNQNKLLIMWAKSPRSSYVSSYSGQIGNQEIGRASCRERV